MIDPVLLQIGSLEVRWYGMLFALGALLGYFLIRKIHHEFDISRKDMEDFFLYGLFAALIGARLFEVLFYDPSYYFSYPWKVFYVWEGGLASHGALLALIVIAYAFSRRRKICFWKLADLFTLPAILAAIFVRIGNFINQELVGRITSVPWAASFQGYEYKRHPVQLYQAVSNFFIFIILFFSRDVLKKYPGLLFSSFLLLFSLTRFSLEFFKDLPRDYGFFYLELNLAQWMSIFIFIISLLLIYFRIRHSTRAYTLLEHH